MPHVTIEHMIMMPILILQIFLFPLTASWIMNIWVNSRRNLTLQEVASHLGSTIQQVYFLLNHKTMDGTLTQETDLPLLIENVPYSGNATLRAVLDPTLDPTGSSSKLLELTLKLSEIGTTTTTSVLLGQNVLWLESTYVSTSPNSGVTATKFPNGTISMSFTS
jgi:hypothetical protein